MPLDLSQLGDPNEKPVGGLDLSNLSPDPEVAVPEEEGGMTIMERLDQSNVEGMAKLFETKGEKPFLDFSRKIPLTDITSPLPKINIPGLESGVNAALEDIESMKVEPTDFSFFKPIETAKGVAGALWNAGLSVPEFMLSAMMLPQNAINDPVGTAAAIAWYAPDQLITLIDADYFNIGSIFGGNKEEARARLFKNPLGPLFAFQMGMGVGKAAGGVLKSKPKLPEAQLMQNIANAKEAMLSMTWDLLRRDTKKSAAKDTKKPVKVETTVEPLTRIEDGVSKPVKKMSEIEAELTAKSDMLPEFEQPRLIHDFESPTATIFERVVGDPSIPRNATSRAGIEALRETTQHFKLQQAFAKNFIDAVHEAVLPKGFKKLRRDIKNIPGEDVLIEMSYALEKTKNPLTGKKPKLTPKQESIVKDFRDLNDAQFLEFQKAGYWSKDAYIENYLSHFLEKPKGKEAKANLSKYVSDIRTGRTMPSLYVAETVYGLKPKLRRIDEIWAKNKDLSDRILMNDQMVRNLSEFKDGGGNRLILPFNSKTQGLTKEGWVKFSSEMYPALTQSFHRVSGKIGKKPAEMPSVLIHEGVELPVKRLFTEVFWEQNKGMAWYRAINYGTKAINLTLSLFHPFSLTESATGVKGPLGFRMAGRGLKELRNPALMRELIEAGVEIGRAPDVGRGIIDRGLRTMERNAQESGIPLVGGASTLLRSFKEVWDKLLWDDYFTGLKASSYFTIAKRLTERFPDIHPRLIKNASARLVNDMFGGQNLDIIMRNPHIEAVTRAFLLAPDWTLSVIKQGFRGLESKTSGKIRSRMAGLKGDAAKEMETMSMLRGSEGRRYWARMGLYGYLGMNTLNYVFSSMNDKMEPHFTWDNEPGKKLSLVLPYNTDDGHTQYATLFKQARELDTYRRDPLGILGNKISPPIRWLFEQGTGSQLGSGFPAPWSKRDPETGLRPTFFESIPDRLKRTFEYVQPFSLGDNSNFALTLPKGVGMTRDRFDQMYRRAFLDEDEDLMDQLEHSAKMNEIEWKPIVKRIKSQLTNLPEKQERQLFNLEDQIEALRERLN